MFRHLLLGKPKYPFVPNLRQVAYDEIFLQSLIRGLALVGEPDSGKTWTLVGHIIDHRINFPDQAGFLLDWSGSTADNYFRQVLQKPEEVRDWLLATTIYVPLGHPKYVLPLPEFSLDYGGSYGDHVERVRRNWVRLAPILTQEAPVLAGLAINVLGKSLFEVLTGIRSKTGDHEETWQLTELWQFLNNRETLNTVFREHLENISKRTRQLLHNRFVSVRAFEGELRTYALEDFLKAIDHRYAQASLGWHTPAWTPREAIEKGLLVIVDGAGLNQHDPTLHYLFTQIYSLIMAEIYKRRPDDPKDKPVFLALDEVYTIISMPGMADEIAKILSLLRTRKLELIVAFQSFSQLSEELREKIWQFANMIILRLQDKREAEEVGYQFLKYNPRAIKLPAVTQTQNPVSEPEHGQERTVADWLCDLPNRHFVMKRYLSSSEKDPFIRYGKTRDLPDRNVEDELVAVKDSRVQDRGILIEDVLAEIEKRVVTVAAGKSKGKKKKQAQEKPPTTD